MTYFDEYQTALGLLDVQSVTLRHWVKDHWARRWEAVCGASRGVIVRRREDATCPKCRGGLDHPE